MTCDQTASAHRYVIRFASGTVVFSDNNQRDNLEGKWVQQSLTDKAIFTEYILFKNYDLLKKHSYIVVDLSLKEYLYTAVSAVAASPKPSCFAIFQTKY